MSFILWRRKERQAKLEEEMRTHLRMATEDRIERGEAPLQAAQAAHHEFGNIALVQQVARDQWGWRWLEEFLQDLRFGARMLAKTPGFTAVAILTLALGIGATTAIFSAVNGVLLSRLPYPHPEQLVSLAETIPPFPQFTISYPDFLDWARINSTFQSLAAYRQNDFNLTGLGAAQRVKAMQVSAAFFPLLGVKPVIGRNFLPDEDKRGGEPVLMVSEALWNNNFGASPEILDKTLTLDGKIYRVIGVVPSRFYFCCASSDFRLGDVYLPLGAWDVRWMQDRGSHPGLFAVGRLKTGVALEKARADMDSIARNLASAYPDTNKNTGVALMPLKQRMVSDAQPMLLILLAAVGFVLAIGCVNVANLLLARSTARAREFALRAALGATRERVIRQLLVESVLLAVIGGALGLLLAIWGTRAGLAMLPEALPRSNNV